MKRALCCTALAALILMGAVRWYHAGVAHSATCPPAGTIAFGETAACAIGIAAEVDTYSFSAVAGDRVLVRAARNPGVTTMSPKLLIDDGSVCSANNGSLTNATLAEVLCLIGTTGTHSISISDYFGSGTGAYGLFLQRTSAPGACTTISFGQTTTASIDLPAEMDSYCFNGSLNDRVLARIARNSGVTSAAPRLRIYRPDGTLLCSENDTALSNAVLAEKLCQLDVSGAFTVLGGDYFNNGAGGYGLYVQRTNNPGSCTNIAFGQTITASIDNPAEMDSYCFTGVLNDQVLGRMARNSGVTSAAPRLRIYGPDGTLLCSANDSTLTNAVLAEKLCQLSVSGTYTILGSDYFNNGAGGYGLYLQRTNNVGQWTLTRYGLTLPGQISRAAEMDTYRFSGMSGDQVHIVMTRNGGATMSPKLRLYRTDGTLLCAANDTTLDNATTADVSCALGADGLYAILGGDYFSNGSGGYGISVNCTAGPCLTVDSDDDGVPDGFDNCPAAANADQLDTDAANLALHRPGVDSIGDACDADDDGDGYTDAQENALPAGGDPLAYCAIMRADVQPSPAGDGAVSILDLAAVSQYFLQSVTPATERFNQDDDGVISILDLAAMSGSFLKQVSSCPSSPPD